MKAATKAALQAAWFTAETRGQIARRHRLSDRHVKRFWAEEKANGRLPDTPRPHFVDRSAPAPAAPDDGDFDMAFDINDDTPIAAPNPTYETQCDALLAALRTHHADGNARKMPSDWLRLDLDVHGAPTPAMLSAFRRARDAAQALPAIDARGVRR